MEQLSETAAATLGPGRYICVRTPGIPGAVIRWALRSDVDHTAVCIGGGRIVEAEFGGVRESPLSKYHGMLVYANTAELITPEQGKEIADRALSFAGSPYNFATIGYQGLRDFLGWRWHILKAMAREPHVFDCSQLAVQAGKAAGLDWMCGRSIAALVTPADLRERPVMERITL